MSEREHFQIVAIRLHLCEIWSASALFACEHAQAGVSLLATASLTLTMTGSDTCLRETLSRAVTVLQKNQSNHVQQVGNAHIDKLYPKVEERLIEFEH